ncbi:MAG TPA: hypothetical protein VFI17_03530 [Solirubrobacterales bacterium]|nr:hypothetical protein [Solirubrobacterales bacterium]
MSVLSDVQIAWYMLRAGFPADPRVLAEGIGVVRAESGGNPKSEVPGNEHIGMWAESSAFGTRGERLDPLAATKAAYKQWLADGKSFWSAWGRWESEQAGRDGATTWHAHLGAARQALAGFGSAPGSGASTPKSAFRRPAAGEEGSGGPSGFLVFLVNGVLILGGVALMAFGGMRAVGAGGGKTGLEGAAA